MAIKRGQGEPFIAIVTDGSDLAKVITNRLLSGLELQKGRIEVHKEVKGNEQELADKLTTAQVTIVLTTCNIQTTTQGLHVVNEKQLYDLQTRKLIQILRPQFIVREHCTKATSKVMSLLAQQQKLTIGIKVSKLSIVDNKHLDFTVTGLRQVLNHFHMVEQGYTLRTLAVFKRHEYTAKEKGLFVPKVGLFDKVEVGTVIGVIKAGNLPIALKSQQNGKVIELSKEKPVNTKDLVFSIGEPTAF